MEQFKSWLELLKTTWETKDPEMALDLVADEFIWFETPFQTPITSKEDLLKEWESIQDHKDITMTHEILSYSDNMGIVKWCAKFKRISSNTDAELEGIYLVKLDSKGKCVEFHQWYNSKY